MSRWVWLGLLLACIVGCSRERGDAVTTQPPKPSAKPTETGTTSTAAPTASAPEPGAHAGYVAAREHLEKARTAQAKDDFSTANAEAKRGIDRLGSEYAPDQVIDDSGQKLAFAEYLEERGEHDQAADTRISILGSRLRLYAQRYPEAPREARALSLALSVTPVSSRVGEKIEATVVLTSSGTEPVVVNTRMALNNVHAPKPFRELTLEVKGPDDEMLPFLAKVRIGAAQADDVRALAPGEKLKRVHELSKYFDLATPGSYSVRAHYVSAPVANAKGQPAWTELVSSDAVKLERTP